MRRQDRQISPTESTDLLGRAEYGILGLITPDGQPYTVPLSYVFMDGAIYVHCAPYGLKIDCIGTSSKAAFTVVGETRPVYVTDFSTYYESAMVFGTIGPVEAEQEKYDALYALAAKYLPDYLDRAEGSITRSFEHTAVYVLRPEQITGKAKKKS